MSFREELYGVSVLDKNALCCSNIIEEEMDHCETTAKCNRPTKPKQVICEANNSYSCSSKITTTKHKGLGRNNKAPINSRLNVVVRYPTPIGLGRNGCWTSRKFQLPRALPFIFSQCCPLNDRRRATHSFFKISRQLSLFLIFCPSLVLLRLFIFLLLLMSGNVHPNPGLIFPCCVCAGNVTWRGKSVQCCICSKWVHLRCSQLSLSIFRDLGSSHSQSCPPAETL